MNLCDICDRPAPIKHDNGSGIVNLCTTCGRNTPEGRAYADRHSVPECYKGHAFCTRH